MSAEAKAQDKLTKRKKFEDVWLVIREEILGHLESIGMPGEAQAWFKRNLETNTPGGAAV